MQQAQPTEAVPSPREGPELHKGRKTDENKQARVFLLSLLSMVDVVRFAALGFCSDSCSIMDCHLETKIT